MKATLAPYPTYKDSGVPWLGEVPEHWEMRRLRNTAEIRVSNVDKLTNNDEHSVRLCNYVDVYKNDRITGRISFMRASATLDEIERFRLKIGDLLITKDSEAWNDIGVPSLVEYSAPDLVSGYHLALVRPHGKLLTGSYGLYVLKIPSTAYQLYVRANGVTRFGLSQNAIKDVVIPLPPLDEQAAIVKFLDYMDRRIRRYVGAKKKLIKLLEEQKQAIIHHAVTRGLDPDVRLKSSCVVWLGDVPEHWKVQRMKTTCGMQSGESITAMSIEQSGDYPVYGGNGIRGYTTRFTHEGQYALIGRQGALCGNVHLARGRFWASEHAIVVATRVGVNVEWFADVLTVMDLNQYSIAAAQPGLAVERVLNLWIPLPPLDEQRSIAAKINRDTIELTTTINRTKQEISLLNEYRTRLIADVVTGKLDVRKVAANLPDEPIESEQLDEDNALVTDDDFDGNDDDIDEELEEVEA
jgi:type I restriction enzyme S subunit